MSDRQQVEPTGSNLADGSAQEGPPAREAARTAGGEPAAALEARGITKRFPGVVANERVSFAAAAGEVHALLGENGAGKSTLCSIMTGSYRPEEGELFVRGEAVRFRSPRDAHAAGIGMVHQHFRLVPSMTVAENVVLGWSQRSRLRFSPRSVEAEVAEVAERYHVRVNPRAMIWQLSLGEQQRVEILKALYREARILLLDEPTAVLAAGEVDDLFASIRRLTADGGTVVFVSHKLPEVMEVADRVTVLRRGRTIGTVAKAGTTPRALAKMMVGREVDLPEKVPDAGAGERPVVLRLEGVSAAGDLGGESLREVSLDVHEGEILGVAGVAGNGQRELAEVISGLRPSSRGRVMVRGRRISGDPRAAIDAGVAFVPEDRMGTGVAGSLPIADNCVLKSYRRRPFSRGPLLRSRVVGAHAARLMDRYDVRAPGPRTLVRQLSGGNVQKLVLAHELAEDPALLVAQSPTHGLDVGAIDAVRRVLLGAASRGVGILLVSEDLDEVLEMSDRVAVMYEGRVVDVFDAADVDVDRVGILMAGGQE
ncbi:MAG TPA: ABC transporter ATP-binding protein [Nocardioidaceae bacterium]|nr:ABC transporter ATP-binding protein [Nocardioidaceae bacterium]